MRNSSKPWYKKWWAISLFIFFGLTIVGTLSNDSSTTQSEIKTEVNNEQVIEESQNKENAQINQKVRSLDYQIVYEVSDKRYDGGKNFYVLADKIDLTNADFKEEIKIVIDEIVKDKGEKISIDFLNDKEILELMYKSHYGSNTLGRILTKEEVSALGDSLVAQFSGQLEGDVYFNTLSFFSGTFTDNPKYGKYVENIEYNPNK